MKNAALDSPGPLSGQSRFRRFGLGPHRSLILFWVAFSLFAVLAGLLGGRLLGTILVLEPPPVGHVDAALVLPGSIPDRALQAVDLVRDGLADSILLGNDSVDEELRELRALGVPAYTNAELNRSILLRMNVPEDRIQILPLESASTWEDALALKDFLRGKRLRSIAIVTCKYHALRSQLNFAKALDGLGVEVFVIPSSYCAFEANGWWRSRLDGWRVLQEWLKLAGYALGYR